MKMWTNHVPILHPEQFFAGYSAERLEWQAQVFDFDTSLFWFGAVDKSIYPASNFKAKLVLVDDARYRGALPSASLGVILAPELMRCTCNFKSLQREELFVWYNHVYFFLGKVLYDISCRVLQSEDEKLIGRFGVYLLTPSPIVMMLNFIWSVLSRGKREWHYLSM